MKTFKDFNLSDKLHESLQSRDIVEPTEIQEKAIPLILDGKDIVGESATGSGKTLAFGAHMLDAVEPGKGIQGLIMTPTRELAEQVRKALSEFSYKDLSLISIYGGVPIERQMHDLPKADIVIATPGRLLDHMERRSIKLSDIKTLVLDEADRMLDMGFIDDVERIMKQCPKERQTLLFSATMPPQIQAIARKYMNDPEYIKAEPQVDPDKLEQVYYNPQRNKKVPLLVHLIKQEKSDLIMVFCNTRRMTDYVVHNLKANDINATAIHGGYTQQKRSKTMENFHTAEAEVLVCTDVAGRGIHVSNVSHIYNYNIPSDSRDYVHRIGRTARAGEKGKVINLLSEEDYNNFGKIQRDYPMFDLEREEMPDLPRVAIVPMKKVDEMIQDRRDTNRQKPRGRPSNRGPRSSGPRRDDSRRDGPRRGSGPQRGGSDRRGTSSRGPSRKGPRRKFGE